MSEAEEKHPAAERRFIDQVRQYPPADTGWIKHKYLDIRYAEGSDRRMLDLYLPDTEEDTHPVLIDIYGGGWYFGSRSSYRADMALSFVPKGYAVASLDYTLSKEVKFPVQVYEIKAAIRYLKNHAAEYHLDPERFAVMGESAGGHLGALALLSTGAGVFEDIPFGEPGDASVKCMIALYTPTNLGLTLSQFYVLGQKPRLPEYGRADSPEGVFLGKKPADAPELVRAADPETYVTKQAPAFLFFHGDEDHLVPYIQSMNLAVKLTEAIGREKVEYFLIHGAGHSQKQFRTPEVCRIIENFLNRELCKAI